MFESECKILYQDYDRRHLKKCLKSLKLRQLLDNNDELRYHISYLEEKIDFLKNKNSKLEQLRNFLVKKGDWMLIPYGVIIIIAMVLLSGY